MAFEITKTTVHRLIVSVSCGCKIGREFEDKQYLKPLNDLNFTGCEKHTKEESLSTIEFILTEYLETEVKRYQIIPENRGTTSVDSHGNVVNIISTNKAHPRTKLSNAALLPRAPSAVDTEESMDDLFSDSDVEP
jgi:hypothetical protein